MWLKHENTLESQVVERHAPSVVAAFDALAQQAPDRLCYAFYGAHGQETERHSFGSLHRRIQSIGRRLADQQGVRRGDRVLIAHPPGLEQMAALLAVMRIGAVAVPVPPLPSRPPTGTGEEIDRIGHVARDCGARFLIAPERASVATTLPRPIDTRLWDDERGPDLPLRAGPIAMLQYTSGSTQMPRGVMLGHENLLANARATVDHDRPVAVTWLPQHHDMGLIGYYLFPQLSGGQTHGFAPATFLHRPLLWLDLIHRTRATATSAPGFGYAQLIQRMAAAPDEARRFDLSSLRMLMAAAEPIPAGLAQRIQHWLGPLGLAPEAFQVAYGLAENTLAVTGGGRRVVSVSRKGLARGMVVRTRRASEVQGAVQLTSCGRPLGTNRIVVVAPTDHRLLPEGAVGEIWVSGPSRGQGYWNQPEATGEVFGADLPDGSGPWLRTGDTGFFDRGELVICGRAKDVIILRGENHHAHDIEQAALAGLALPAAVLAAAFETHVGEVAAAVLVLGLPRGVEVDPAAVARAVQARLGIALLAVTLVPQREIPRTSSGKIRRQRVAGLWTLQRLSVLAEHRADATLPPDGHVFTPVFARYGFDGTEAVKIGEAGFDSLDLVNILHGLQELLAEAGAEEFSESLDARLVQQVTIAQLSAFAEEMRRDPAQAALAAQALVAEMRMRETELERVMMRRDAAQALAPARIRSLATGTAEATLLTGATGFLGPFLLTSLLEQTDRPVIALVRAETDAEATDRLAGVLARSGLLARLGPSWQQRVTVVAGDLEKPALGLQAPVWDWLTEAAGSILHNGAQVNYLFDYARMRAANVMGTAEVIRLSRDGVLKPLNLISTTFIFGWSTTPILREADGNAGMEGLDFGYSQSKWVSETLVARLAAESHPLRIFRPALVTPSVDGQGQALDITLRLLAFMIKHGLGISAGNQVSMLPADATAANIVAIATGDAAPGTFHVTRDDYTRMEDVTAAISRQTGQKFTLFPVKQFVGEVIRRCTPDDPLFPLLSFLVGSADAIAAMEFKRYDNKAYRTARDASGFGRPDPDLDATVGGILTCLRRLGAI